MAAGCSTIFPARTAEIEGCSAAEREVFALVGAVIEDVGAVLAGAAGLGPVPIAGGRTVLTVGIGAFLTALVPAAMPRYRLIVGVKGSTKLEEVV